MTRALSRTKSDDWTQRLHQIISCCSDADTRRSRRAAQALSRIREGTYGYCMGCGLQIPEREMELKPERRYCARCQPKDAG